MLLSAICVCDIKLDMGTLDLLVLKKHQDKVLSHECTLRFRSSNLYTKDVTCASDSKAKRQLKLAESR